MKSNIVAIIVAVAVFGGLAYFFFYRGGAPQAAETPAVSPPQAQESTSTATNYDECIAEGNKPLPDAPDKCLTKNGHLFIQGVVE